MIVTVVLPDEVYAKYAERSPDKPAFELSEQLKRFQDYPSSERAVIFPPEVKRELEVLYGKPIEDQAKFVEWVRNIVSLNINGAEVALTEAQQKQLAAEARFFVKAPEVLLKEKVKEGILNAFRGVA